LSTLAHAIRSAVEELLYPFDLLPPLLSLLLVSILSGAGMLWVVGKTTPQKALERARDRLAAGIYEVRLFLDAPRRVLGAQVGMIKWSIIYVGLVIPALLVMAIPLGLFYLHLETRHGLAPLPVGEPLVVRVDLADGADGRQVSASEMSSDVIPTAPPLYDADRQRVYLRVEVQRPGTHELELRIGEHAITKRLVAAAGEPASPERTRGAALFIAATDEPPLAPDGPIEQISVAHAAAETTYLGVPMPWWLFWLGIATIAALALRRPMGIVL